MRIEQEVKLRPEATSAGNGVLRQLAELETLDMAHLKERWRTLFGTEPPGYNRPFLVKRLAYRIQELAYGGLPQEVRERMRNFLDEEGYDDLGRQGEKPKARLNAMSVPGTVFVREWDGVRHEVRAVPDGFEYRGRLFKSLSAAARAITGTRWNGPRFFGIREDQRPKARQAGEQR